MTSKGPVFLDRALNFSDEKSDDDLQINIQEEFDMLNKKSVDDINVKGLRVLVRCDFNVPLKEGKITD